MYLSWGELTALILPWAQAEHPDKYTATLRVQTHAATFRKYLLRLIEIRCETDTAFWRSLPLSVLDETSICKRWRSPNGTVLTVGGKGTVPPPQLRYSMLNATPEAIAKLIEAITTLDLETFDVSTDP